MDLGVVLALAGLGIALVAMVLVLPRGAPAAPAQDQGIALLRASVDEMRPADASAPAVPPAAVHATLAPTARAPRKDGRRERLGVGGPLWECADGRFGSMCDVASARWSTTRPRRSGTASSRGCPCRARRPIPTSRNTTDRPTSPPCSRNAPST